MSIWGCSICSEDQKITVVNSRNFSDYISCVNDQDEKKN